MKAFSDILDQVKDCDAQLIAVSKTRSNDEVMSLYKQGQRDFGENRIEEIEKKKLDLPSDIRWHLIGPLQSKKVKIFSSDIHLFHALDRVKIWNLLNSWAADHEVTVDVLIQVHVAQESTKHGFDPQELKRVLDTDVLIRNDLVKVKGLMAMATNTEDEGQVAAEFEEVKVLFDELRSTYFADDSFTELSMGMSNDYKIALRHGATMVRIGSLLFGPRQY